MQKRRLLAVLCILLISTLSVFAGGTQETAAEEDYKLVLRLSHVFSPAEQLTISMDEVADIIYERLEAPSRSRHPQDSLQHIKTVLSRS